MECEENDELDANSDSEGSDWQEEKELAETRYKHALRKLKKAFPDEHCDWTDDGVCETVLEGCTLVEHRASGPPRDRPYPRYRGSVRVPRLGKPPELCTEPRDRGSVLWTTEAR